MEESKKNTIVGGAFELGSGVVSSGLNAIFGELAARKQYERQLDFWNRQNEYNSPIQQRARLEAAGLNPAMLNGNSVSNTAGELSQVPGNDAMKNGLVEKMDLLGAFLGSKKIEAEIDLMKAQAEKARASANLDSGNLSLISTREQLMQSQVALNESKTISQNLKNDFTKATMDMNIENVSIAVDKAREELNDMKLRNPLERMRIEKATALLERQCLVEEAKKRLMESNIEVNDAVIEKYAEEILNLKNERFINTSRAQWQNKVDKSVVDLNEARSEHIRTEITQMPEYLRLAKQKNSREWLYGGIDLLVEIAKVYVSSQSSDDSEDGFNLISGRDISIGDIKTASKFIGALAD